MIKSLLTVSALLLCSASFGQNYLVTVKGDTMRGEVRLLSYDVLDRVQLSEEKKKKTTYTALQVRRANIDGEDYAPVKFDNSVRMMKMIRSGFLSLYSFRAPGQTTYDTKILQKIGTAAMEVPNIGFKRFVGELTADCPAVSDKVKNGDFDRYHVEDMVDQYNQCIVNSSKRTGEPVKEKSTPASEMIEQMKIKVNASDLNNKTDVNDLLNSIAEKVTKKEAVPAYMKEGLKGYLSSNEGLKADMEQLFTLIDD